MGKIQSGMPDVDCFIWPCDCVGGNHYLKIYWDNDVRPGDPSWLIIEGEFSDWRLRARIKEALRVLKRGSGHTCELILTPEVVAEIAEFFKEKYVSLQND